MITLLAVILSVLRWAIQIYIYVLWARFIMEWITVLNRGFRPRGVILVLFEVVYTITDPPIKLIRRVLPPIRLGQVAIDLGWMVTMFGCWILLMIIPAVAW